MDCQLPSAMTPASPWAPASPAAAVTQAAITPVVCGGGTDAPGATDSLAAQGAAKPFQCALCPRAYTLKTSLRRHEASKHTGVRHECPYCGCVLASKEVLRRHVSRSSCWATLRRERSMTPAKWTTVMEAAESLSRQQCMRLQITAELYDRVRLVIAPALEFMQRHGVAVLARVRARALRTPKAIRTYAQTITHCFAALLHVGFLKSVNDIAFGVVFSGPAMRVLLKVYSKRSYARRKNVFSNVLKLLRYVHEHEIAVLSAGVRKPDIRSFESYRLLVEAVGDATHQRYLHLRSHPRVATLKNEGRWLSPDELRHLVRMCFSTIDKAAASEPPTTSDRRRAAAALAVLLLSRVPPRRLSLLNALCVGETLIRTDSGGWVMQVPSKHTKTSTSVRLTIPDDVGTAINTYIQHLRPRDTNDLFAGLHTLPRPGGPTILSTCSMRVLITSFVHDITKKRLFPHLFRHLYIAGAMETGVECCDLKRMALAMGTRGETVIRQHYGEQNLAAADATARKYLDSIYTTAPTTSGDAALATDAEGQRQAASGETAGGGDNVDDATAEYDVGSIVDHRQRNGITEYRCRWVGYGADSDTWEPVHHLTQCVELVSDYWLKQRER